MGCWSHHDRDRWANKMERMQYKMDRMRGRMERGGWGFGPPTSGNRAFDEYRSETLRRLEEEQVEFKNFLDRLRHARTRKSSTRSWRSTRRARRRRTTSRRSRNYELSLQA